MDFKPMEVHSGTTISEIIEYTMKHNPDFKNNGFKRKYKHYTKKIKKLLDR